MDSRDLLKGLPVQSASPTTAGLPAPLVEQAAARLGIVSLIYAATYSIAFYQTEIARLFGAEGAISAGRFEHAVAALSIGASLAIFVSTRWFSFRPQTLLDVGLIYQVLASFGIAIAEMWRVDFAVQLEFAAMGGQPWWGISWVCVWILAFPVVVPNTPGKTFLASVASACTPPLALLVSQTLNDTAPVPSMVWIAIFVATLTCAGLAWFTSRLIYGLGRDIREAQEMGSYRLVEKLGQGGMGEVWRAEHRMLARPAAIKLIRSEKLGHADDAGEIRRRFGREAETTALLRSPHTVQLYDFGITPEGRFYYVMELLDGLDLESFVSRFGRIPAARAAAWLRQACSSLAEAHDRGLVHRDIKPANIYVSRLGTEVDFVKILDFGLVKPSVVEEDTRLTTEGVAAGTPAYMAPEMAQGLLHVDHRADIYALGCVAYWLITGTQVFAGEGAVQVIVEHVRTPPQAPSERIEEPLPRGLDELVLECLAKSPDERPQSAAEIAQRLSDLGIEDGWSSDDAHSWWDTHLPGSA